VLTSKPDLYIMNNPTINLKESNKKIGHISEQTNKKQLAAIGQAHGQIVQMMYTWATLHVHMH